MPSAIPPEWHELINNVHDAFAALFFLAISAMALLLFKNRGKHDWANVFYEVCGGDIFICLLWMAVGVTFSLSLRKRLQWRPSAAWLVNGMGVLKEPQDRPLPSGLAPLSKFA